MALSKELAAIQDAMDKTTGDGRDHGHAVELSRAYVQAHPELTAEMHDWTLEEIVSACSQFRAAELASEGKAADAWTEKKWQLEAYHLAKFPPQNIGGEYHVEASLPEL